jgi:FG-GAP-like repeat
VDSSYSHPVTGTQDGKLQVLVGKGDGTFGAGKPLPLVTKGIWDIAVADFNGDGRADFALTTANVLGDPSSVTSVYLGNGDATFRAPVNTTIPGANSWLVVADVNKDGRPDLVSMVYPDFDVLINDGKWSGL